MTFLYCRPALAATVADKPSPQCRWIDAFSIQEEGWHSGEIKLFDDSLRAEATGFREE